MISRKKKSLLFTIIFGPLGLFYTSKTGGLILTLFAIILAQVFFNEIGHLPLSWFILNVLLSFFWAKAALSRKKGSRFYTPYIIEYYKEEKNNTHFLVNTFLGILQFAFLILIVSLIIKYSIE